jgi:hypothetical protein
MSYKREMKRTKTKRRKENVCLEWKAPGRGTARYPEAKVSLRRRMTEIISSSFNFQVCKGEDHKRSVLPSGLTSPWKPEGRNMSAKILQISFCGDDDVPLSVCGICVKCPVYL